MPEMLDEGAQRYGRTKMPTYVGEDPPFIAWQELKISLRQVLTLLIGLFVWYIAAKIAENLPVIPFSSLFAFLIFIWIPLGTVYLSFGKRHGIPVEEYLADKLMHRVRPHYYAPMDPSAEHGEIDEYDWESD